MSHDRSLNTDLRKNKTGIRHAITDYYNKVANEKHETSSICSQRNTLCHKNLTLEMKNGKACGPDHTTVPCLPDHMIKLKHIALCHVTWQENFVKLLFLKPPKSKTTLQCPFLIQYSRYGNIYSVRELGTLKIHV